jgi:hypothetical protein
MAETRLPNVSFNPRPAFRPGDAAHGREARQIHIVSIRARPFGRAMRTLSGGQLSRYLFQSAPGLSAGRCSDSPSFSARTVKFQSAPGLSAGRCLDAADAVAHALVVSIRARPFGRAMPLKAPSLPPPACCFNPRPAFRPGDARRRAASLPAELCFNPRPAFRPGDAMWRPASSASARRFQSAPGLSAGRCSTIATCCFNSAATQACANPVSAASTEFSSHSSRHSNFFNNIGLHHARTGWGFIVA